MTAELITALAATSPWEALAVLLAVAYLVLAARENIACWSCALVSSAIYIALFWKVRLLMEAALNVYYLLMALYGWYEWRYGGQGRGIGIRRWRWRQHLTVVAGVTFAAAVTGYLLSQHTDAAWPYVDSFTTWGSVVTTFMVARKILENWIYWLVLDAICIPLYIERGLYLTAVLFALYLVIVVIGFFNWRRLYVSERALAVA